MRALHLACSLCVCIASYFEHILLVESLLLFETIAMSSTVLSSLISEALVNQEVQDEATGEAFEGDNTRADLSPTNCDSFMSIYYNNLKLGISYYHIHLKKIGLFHEMYDYYNFELIISALKQLKPANVIVNNKCDENLLNFLKSVSNNPNELEMDKENTDQASCSTKSDHGDTFFKSYAFDLAILSDRYFQYDYSKDKILALDLPAIQNVLDPNERFIYLTGYINFSETSTIKSLGALIFFIEKGSFSKFMMPKIENFTYLYLDQYLTLDNLTFEALEIFQQEWHPSVTKRGLYKKEGLSLYSVFNNCVTKAGSFRLKKIFQQPSSDYKCLKERYDLIDFFLDTRNVSLRNSIVESLKQVKDLCPIFKRFKMTNFVLNDFQILHRTISNIMALKRDANKVIQDFNLLNNLKSIDLQEVLVALNYMIDFEKSAQDNDTVIKRNVDNEFDELRDFFNELPNTLNKTLLEDTVLNVFMCKDIEEIRHVYIPQLGFHLVIPLVKVQNVCEDVKDGLDLIFCANDLAYFKTDKLREFDKNFGSIELELVDRQRLLLIGLRDSILDKEPLIEHALELCAELDAMLAMALTALNYNYVRPTITRSQQIRISKGRHPLYELMIESCVTNDCSIDNNNISIIFGTNGCGKTVYLKQMCLIVYMAHIGSFVPAHRARIPLMNQIITRIKTPESISTQLSSFKHDLNQMIMATNNADRQSLVAVDFFGKGTLSVDGKALLFGCIRYWLENNNRPLVFISTEFNLFESLFIEPSIECFTFGDQSTDDRFKLIKCKSYADFVKFSEKKEEIAFSGKIEKRIAKISSEILIGRYTNIYPALMNNFNKYLIIADSILNETFNEESVADINAIITGNPKN